MSNKPQLNSKENDVKSLKHSENNFLSPIKEKFHRKSTSNKGDIIKVNMNNNNNNFNKTNSKKKIEFSNVDFKLDSSKNKDLVKTAQNLTNFLKTKTLVNNQINDFIRRNSNISISNSSLATILENSNPAYAIANIALTSPNTVKRQKTKKKKNNNNLNINSPKNKNARKSFTFLDLIKQENHQNLRNSMILTQPNIINNNIEMIKHKLKKTSNDNIKYKNTISSNSKSNKKLSSKNNINLNKNLYSSFILPSNVTKNLIKKLNQNSDNYFQSYENDLISSNINNILKKKRHSIVNYNNSNKLYEDFSIISPKNEIFGSKKNSFNDKTERISNRYERKKLKRLTNYKNKNNLNINPINIKSSFSKKTEEQNSEKSNEPEKFKSLKKLQSLTKLQKVESKVYKNDEKKENNNKNNDNDNEIDENENMEYLKHIHELKYRNLSIKNKLVYDSLSDEESEDDLDEVFYINPRSNYKLIFDMMIFLCNLYFTFTYPLISSFYPNYQRKYFSWYTLLNYIVDIFYILDLISGFFTAFYNIEEQLITKLNILAINYLFGWFIIDLISAIPFTSIFNLYQARKKGLFLTYAGEYEVFYLLEYLRLFKAFKAYTNNYFLNFATNFLSSFSTLYKWSIVYFFLIIFIM